MGIYLPNMEMPRKGQMLVIFPDGTSYVCFNGMRERLAQTKAFPVPPHGDLISRETAKLYHSYLVDERTDTRVPAIPLSVLNVIPTIIPAEPAEEGQ